MSVLSHILLDQTRGHFQQMGRRKSWPFSFEARYTVTRIALFRFADTTSASVPQSKDFPGARESASSPAVSKINIPAASAPRTAKLYHFPSPRVNRRACPKRKFRTGCKHGAESMHTCSKRHLLPGQRSADNIAVCTNRDLIRQLALRW